MADLNRLRRSELIALVRRFAGGLDRGRKKGAQVQRIGAVLRQSLIDGAVADLMRNGETANWRTGALVDFIYERQRVIGLRPPYSKSSLDRRVRASLRKWRTARSSQSLTKNGKALAASSENRP